MAHSVYRLFMDDLRHWNILDTIFYDFYLFSNWDVYPEIRFRVKGTNVEQSIPRPRYSAIMAINSFDLRPMLLKILMHFNG